MTNNAIVKRIYARQGAVAKGLALGRSRHDDAIPCSLPSPRANYQRNEIRQHINAALAQLSPEHRAVIVLKEIEDLQYQEIAEILNLSIGTVMSRLFYGRKKLQSMLRPIYNQIYQTRPSVSVP